MIKKIALTLIIVLFVVVYGGKQFVTHKLEQEVRLLESEIFILSRGITINHLSQQLIQKGWIDNSFWLKFYIRFNPELAKLKAGTYQIPPKISLLDLIKLLVEGKEHQFHITFIEGSTFKEWLLLLSNAPYIQKTFNDTNISDIAKTLGIKDKNPEGLFFPETYAYTANTTDKSILLRAHQKMKKVLEQQWKNRQKDLPYRSSYEALIMASIIEKESGVHAEQPLIASVFINRLRKKMRLQTDPTVIYGLGERYQGDIKYKHLREKTPYNTYRINGLTPTPIAMPGFKAINAAMQPATSEYFYFVSNGHGEHVFSRDLAAHNKAVKAYLLSL